MKTLKWNLQMLLRVSLKFSSFNNLCYMQIDSQAQLIYNIPGVNLQSFNWIIANYFTYIPLRFVFTTLR